MGSRDLYEVCETHSTRGNLDTLAQDPGILRHNVDSIQEEFNRMKAQAGNGQ
jgi:hypothetical protein